MSLAEGLAATALSYRAANPLCNKSMPCTRWVMSLAIGPTVSKCFGEIGNTPLMGTRPKVVFKPQMPQQAAGRRMDPAVSVPKAASAIPVSTATAEPLDEPPGINLCLPSKRFLGVPKYSFLPETVTANSVRFVLPTICTFRSRASSRHFASCKAGGLVLATYSEPAVVTTPFMSMRSLTARRNCLLFSGGGQQKMNALSRVPVRECLSKAEQPLKKLTSKSP